MAGWREDLVGGPAVLDGLGEGGLWWERWFRKVYNLQIYMYKVSTEPARRGSPCGSWVLGILALSLGYMVRLVGRVSEGPPWRIIRWGFWWSDFVEKPHMRYDLPIV